MSAVELPTRLAQRFRVEPVRPTDADDVFELVVACETPVLGYADYSIEDARQDVVAEAPGGVRFQETVWDADRLVAWWWTDPRPDSVSLTTDSYVHPELDAPDADAIAALGWRRVTRWAQQRYAGWNGPDPYLEAGSLHGDADTERRLGAAGFARARVFWRMAGDVAEEPIPTPAPGISIRPVQFENEADTRLVHEIKQESFADHWGTVAESYETFMARWHDLAGFDPSLWFVAELDGRPVGILLASRNKEHEQALHVSVLGTLAEARRRGVGGALLHHAYEVARAQGYRQVSLGVDSDNPTGAPSLYRRAGLRTTFAMSAWRKSLAQPTHSPG